MPYDHHAPLSLKERLDISDDMYERIRLHNVKLTKQLAEAETDAKHLQDVLNAKDETIRELREQLKPRLR